MTAVNAKITAAETYTVPAGQNFRFYAYKSSYTPYVLIDDLRTGYLGGETVQLGPFFVGPGTVLGAQGDDGVWVASGELTDVPA